MKAEIFKKINSFLNIIIENGNRKRYKKKDFEDYVKFSFTFDIKGGCEDTINYLIPRPSMRIENIESESFDSNIDINQIKFIVYDKNNSKSNFISSFEFLSRFIKINDSSPLLFDNEEYKMIDNFYVYRNFTVLYNQNNLLPVPICEEKILIEKWIESDFSIPLLVLGDRGSGKSWFMKNILQDLFNKFKEDPWINPLPVYVDLRELAKKKANVSNLYNAILGYINENEIIDLFDENVVWESLLRNGNLLLLFDGLDEMSKEASSEILTKNLYEIFDIQKITNKIIITSRLNYFDSYKQIFEHFAYTYYMNNYMNENFILDKSNEALVRKNFAIVKLDQFTSKEFNSVKYLYSKKGDKKRINGTKIVSDFEKRYKSPGTIEFEIVQLSKIPGFFEGIIEALGNESMCLIDIFKSTINSKVFRYNVDASRSIRFLPIYDKTKGKYLDDANQPSFNIEKKNEVLRNIAWFCFERGINNIYLKEFSPILLATFGYNYDIIINDLKTQTLIKLTNDNQFSFMTEGIHAYYLSSYLYHLIRDNNENEFINNLGKFDFNNNLGIRTLTFLNNELLKHEVLRNQVSKSLEKRIKTERPFSPVKKYLFTNISLIAFNIDYEIINFWEKFPDSKDNIDIALLPGNENIDPFFLSINEVTNIDFDRFLKDKDFEGFYWKKKYKEHVKDENNKHKNNPFKEVINDYHLLYWVDGKIPIDKKNHPVVYISWFAAAMYCNWLSKKAGINEKNFYYKFSGNDKSLIVEINSKSYGFRLPTRKEWDYANREGNYNNNSFMDKFRDNLGKLTPEGLKIKENLLNRMEVTLPVRSGNPNIFGIYGLLGNVREWVDIELSICSVADFSIIKGATYLQSDYGLEFKYSDKVFAQNTNFDVGFRVARKLSTEENEIFDSAQDYFKSISK